MGVTTLGNRPKCLYSMLGDTTVAVYVFLIPGDDKAT